VIGQNIGAGILTARNVINGKLVELPDQRHGPPVILLENGILDAIFALDLADNQIGIALHPDLSNAHGERLLEDVDKGRVFGLIVGKAALLVVIAQKSISTPDFLLPVVSKMTIPHPALLEGLTRAPPSNWSK